MTKLLAGASGLIGSELIPLIPPDQLHIITRRPLDGVASQSAVPTDQWPDAIKQVRPSIAISTLGTTRRKAGSDEAFRAVDLDLVLTVARAAREAGARHFILVSSAGTSSQSKGLYLRTKADAEAGVKALGFERVDILRPGLLRGTRTGDRRFGERLAILISPVTDALTPEVLSQFRSISAKAVARAIAALCERSESGVFHHHNQDMLALGASSGHRI